jgi:hypothetical protein
MGERENEGGYGPWVAFLIALVVALIGMEVMCVEPIDIKMNFKTGGCE